MWFRLNQYIYIVSLHNKYMNNMTPEEIENFKNELKIALKDVMSALTAVQKDISKAQTQPHKLKIYTEQLALQNSLLIGFIKFKNLEDEYSEFSKDYTEWNANEPNSKKI